MMTKARCAPRVFAPRGGRPERASKRSPQGVHPERGPPGKDNWAITSGEDGPGEVYWVTKFLTNPVLR